MSLPLPYGVGLVDPQCPIDWSHPLNFGLVADYTITPNSGWRGGSAVVDLVRGGKLPHDSAWVSTRAWSSSLGRRGGYGSIQTNGTSSYTSSATVPGVNGATYLSYATWVYRSATGIINAWGRTESDAGANKAFSCIWFSNDQIYVTTQNGSNNVYQNTDPITTTGWHHVCVVFDGTQSTDATRAKLYVNGKLVAYTGSAGTVPTTVVSDTKGWGWGTDRSGRYGVGNYDSMQVYLRALAVKDIQQLLVETSAGNPNRWRWLLKGAWFPVEQGGGGAFTLNLETGSYSVTGASSTLLANRKLNTESGSYSITGSNATLLTNRKLNTEAGAYTLTGSAQTQLWNHRLNLEAGSYSITGFDATLLKTGAYTLTLDPGSYAITGADATLLHNRLLNLAAGSYSITGFDATLVKQAAVTYTLNLEGGSYSVTGAAQTLLWNRSLNLVAGSYSITGSSATLVAGNPPPPPPHQCNWNPQPASGNAWTTPAASGNSWNSPSPDC